MQEDVALLTANGDGWHYVLDTLGNDFGIPPRYVTGPPPNIVFTPLPCTFTTLQRAYLSPMESHIAPLAIENGKCPSLPCMAGAFEYIIYQRYDISYEASLDRYKIELTITEAEAGVLLYHVEYVDVP